MKKINYEDIGEDKIKSKKQLIFEISKFFEDEELIQLKKEIERIKKEK